MALVSGGQSMVGKRGGWAVASTVFFLSLFPALGQAADQGQAYVSNHQVAKDASASRSMQSFDAFFATLRHMESGGDYRSVNTLNFVGAYQFGEAALVDLGYVRRDPNVYDNNFGGGFTGKDGIRSVGEFLNNPRVQDKAARTWMKVMWRYIEGERLHRYAWTKVGGVILTPSGMLGATHLLGTGGLHDFIRSGGSSKVRDPYGTPILRYVKKLADFDIPLGPEKPNVIASLN